MSLFSGDLTTSQQVANWLASPPSLPNAKINQLISSMSAMIKSHLNRASLYSQMFTRTIDGVGNYQIILPDYPVTSITSIQVGAVTIPPYPLPTSPPNYGIPGINTGWGYRFVPWSGYLPGDPSIVEFVNGSFYGGVQNIKVIYTAGYLISNEPVTVPSSPGPYTITVLQPQGIWCRDNGVTYTSSGISLTPVASSPSMGQYIPPPDSSPGLYTFSPSDDDADLLVSYSFIPADLGEACNQMIAERLSYQGRVGNLSKSLSGQETVRYMRGGGKGTLTGLPPEVEGLILPYISVIPPKIGAPL